MPESEDNPRLPLSQAQIEYMKSMIEIHLCLTAKMVAFGAGGYPEGSLERTLNLAIARGFQNGDVVNLIFEKAIANMQIEVLRTQ